MGKEDCPGKMTGIGKNFWELIKLYFWQGATVKQAIQAAVEVCVDSNTDGTGCPYIGSDECSNCDIAENVVRRLAEYEDTGLTPEQVQELKEKQIPKKPIEEEKQYSEDYGFNSDILCPVCNNYIGYYTEAMCKPEYMQYCNECGQRLEVEQDG